MNPEPNIGLGYSLPFEANPFALTNFKSITNSGESTSATGAMFSASARGHSRAARTPINVNNTICPNLGLCHCDGPKGWLVAVHHLFEARKLCCVGRPFVSYLLQILTYRSSRRSHPYDGNPQNPISPLPRDLARLHPSLYIDLTEMFIDSSTALQFSTFDLPTCNSIRLRRV